MVGPDSSPIVLLVDDTALLRRLVGEYLGDLGYTVLVANGGEDALRLAAEHHGEIHILFTDVMMPGMRGPELADRIRASRPEIAILFMSGSGLGELADQALIRAAGGVVLNKPFTQEELAIALRKVQHP
jgi:CheY-like chemotaxis protein